MYPPLKWVDAFMALPLTQLIPYKTGCKGVPFKKASSMQSIEDWGKRVWEYGRAIKA
jgi:hypothetical protein